MATGVAILIGYTAGLAGVAIALVASRLLVFVVDFGLLSRIVSIPITAYITRCYGPIIACAAMIGVLTLMPTRTGETADWLATMAAAAGASLAYVAAIALLDWKEIAYYYKLLAR